MKKLAITIISALAALVICAVAFANNTAVELYDKTADLLFGTSNVTLKAHAEFSLDGNRFKTVDGEWKQDGSRSYRQLLLSSPRADGSERRNGYTIVTEKNDLYLMEVFTPGIYRQGYAGERASILRNTVETKQLINLGRVLASQSDLFLGAGAITKTDDGSFRVVIGNGASESANAILNQFVRFAAKRYFGIDYDMNLSDSGMSLYHYVTATQGILYTMRGIALQKADITLKADENGSLLQAEGIVSLSLETSADGVKQLDISFRADVSDLGSTTLNAFDPKDYAVVPVPVEEVDPGFGSVIVAESPEAYSLINEELENMPFGS